MSAIAETVNAVQYANEFDLLKPVAEMDEAFVRKLLAIAYSQGVARGMEIALERIDAVTGRTQ